MSDAPTIEGASEPTSEPSKRVERQVVGDQAKHMDMEKPQAPEENVPNRDIKEKESFDDKMEKAEEVAENNLSTKNEATLPKAKKNASTVKRRTKASTAIGNPAPNYLADLSTKINTFYDEFKQSFSLLQDMQKRIGHEAPLQDNNNVQPSRKRSVEFIPYTNDRIDIRDDREKYRMADNERHYQRSSKRPREVDFDNEETMRELEHYRRRNQNAMNQAVFHNQKMSDRASVDTSSVKQPSNVYW